MPFKRYICLLVVTCLMAGACETVKPYQRAYVNDASMQTGRQSIKKFSGNAHTFREGASGGGRGKNSGGCGCN